MPTSTPSVFSTASPFAAAPPPLVPAEPAEKAPDPADLTPPLALIAWQYLVKLVREGTAVTPALLGSIAEKVNAGVLMTAAQMVPPTRLTVEARDRAQVAAYFGLNR
jgi:hypothetical protein